MSHADALDPAVSDEYLTTLLDINQILTSAPNLRSALRRVLEILARQYGMMRGAVTLLAPDGTLNTEAIHGFAGDGGRARYRIGEGITGKVVESGKPVVVPQVSQEPAFLNRAAAAGAGQQELSFICVPIVLEPAGRSARSPSICRSSPTATTSRTCKFFGVVASMIGAGASRVQRLVGGGAPAARRREHAPAARSCGSATTSRTSSARSGPMRQVYEQIAQVARTNTTVLIRGESGTGKELIAHAIHYNSPRAKKPFVKVSCAALPDSADRVGAVRLREGRVHRRADARRRGGSSWPRAARCSSTRSATCNLATQVKLLRVLQEREFERLGGTETDQGRTSG